MWLPTGLPLLASRRCARCAPAPSSCRPARTQMSCLTGKAWEGHFTLRKGEPCHPFCSSCRMLPWLLRVAHISQPPPALPAARRHTRSECDPSNYDKVHRKPRCTAPGCREKLTSTNSYTCRDCGVTVRCLAACFAPCCGCQCLPEQSSAVLCIHDVPTTHSPPPPPPCAGVPAAPPARRPQVPWQSRCSRCSCTEPARAW